MLLLLLLNVGESHFILSFFIVFLVDKSFGARISHSVRYALCMKPLDDKSGSGSRRIVNPLHLVVGFGTVL